jgi:hypothetical protein
MVPLKSKNSPFGTPGLWSAVAVIIMALVVSGCLKNYGRLQRDPQVTKSFDDNTVNPGYQYFYYGRSNQPYVIVGIDRTYYMDSRMWREVEPNSDQFKEMVYWIWTDVLYAPYYGKGAHILDPQGNKVGLWYSHFWWAAIRFSDDNRIEIMPDIGGSGDAVR